MSQRVSEWRQWVFSSGVNEPRRMRMKRRTAGQPAFCILLQLPLLPLLCCAAAGYVCVCVMGACLHAGWLVCAGGMAVCVCVCVRGGPPGAPRVTAHPLSRPSPSPYIPYTQTLHTHPRTSHKHTLTKIPILQWLNPGYNSHKPVLVSICHI